MDKRVALGRIALLALLMAAIPVGSVISCVTVESRASAGQLLVAPGIDAATETPAPQEPATPADAVVRGEPSMDDDTAAGDDLRAMRHEIEALDLAEDDEAGDSQPL